MPPQLQGTENKNRTYPTKAPPLGALVGLVLGRGTHLPEQCVVLESLVD